MTTPTTANLLVLVGAHGPMDADRVAATFGLGVEQAKRLLLAMVAAGNLKHCEGCYAITLDGTQVLMALTAMGAPQGRVSQ